MPFSFNFQVESESTSDSNLDSKVTDQPKVTWKSCKEHFIDDCHLERIAKTDRIDSYPVGGGETLNIGFLGNSLSCSISTHGILST